MPARVTPIEMPAECRRATAPQRAQHGSLLHAQPRVLLDEAIGLRAEDVSHLHGRPAHDCVGARRRERGRMRGIATCSCSRGFGAACR